MEKILKEYTKEHFTFTGKNSPAVVDPDKGTFEGVAYSGGLIEGHWWWDRLLIDLDTMSIPDKAIPLLVEHDRERLAGRCELIKKDTALQVSGPLYPDDISDDAKRIRAFSKHGHEWEMSIWVPPGSIEEVEPGQEVFVNGHSHTGPLHIFRNTKLMEASFCVFGADPNTSANAFNDERTKHNIPGGQIDMELEERLKKLESQFSAQTAENAELKTGLETANARAAAAESDLAKFHKEARIEKVKALFKHAGIDATEDAINPYLGMDEATFSAVSENMKSVKTNLPDGMFEDLATAGEGESFTKNELLDDAKSRSEV